MVPYGSIVFDCLSFLYAQILRNDAIKYLVFFFSKQTHSLKTAIKVAWLKNLINIVVYCDAISVTSTRMGIFFGVIFLFYSPNTHRAFSLVLLFFFLLQPTELKHVSRLEKGKKASQRIMKNTYLILRSNCNVFDSTICSYDSKSGYE